MKRLNDFIETAHLFWVFLFGWFFTGLFIASIFYFSGSFVVEPRIFGMVKCIEMGAMSGVPFGLMVMLTASMIRSSQRFWNFAECVEHLIEHAETRTDLESVFSNDFQKLINLSGGGVHRTELTRLYTIMKTKYKYIENERVNKTDII